MWLQIYDVVVVCKGVEKADQMDNKTNTENIKQSYIQAVILCLLHIPI
jgi:hypothetical protein